jgi:hypothetical protein
VPDYMVIDNGAVPHCIVVETDDDDYALSVYTLYSAQHADTKLLLVEDITPEALPRIVIDDEAWRESRALDDFGRGVAAQRADADVRRLHVEPGSKLDIDLGAISDAVERTAKKIREQGGYVGLSAQEIERRVLAGESLTENLPTVETTDDKPES